MDEQTTVQNETEELEAGTLAAFDEGWDEDETPVATADGQADTEEESEEPETESESEETEADADQRKADGNEGGEADASSEGESKGDEGSSDQGESFILKHLGEERSVGRDEVVTLAQKGLDYDRIREKWDGVKDDLPMYQMEHAFLQELAEARGGDIAGLIDETRTRTILAKAEAEGKELSPAAAAAQAVKMRAEFTPAGNAPAQDTEEARQERVRQDIARFKEGYPDIRMEDIPQEVWQEVDKNGGDLLGCYRRFENQKLKDELKGLKKELEEAKQQKKNKERSTGSTKSIGAAAKKDAFDEGWDFDS